MGPQAPAPVVPPPEVVTCPQCPAGACVWSSWAALCTHRVRAHGFREPLRRLVARGVTVCRFCGLDLRARHRLLHHLGYSSKVCHSQAVEALGTAVLISEEEAAAALNLEVSQHRARARAKPVSAGPL